MRKTRDMYAEVHAEGNLRAKDTETHAVLQREQEGTYGAVFEI
jgi:hypothetical protein